jgi:hypothetical protein
MANLTFNSLAGNEDNCITFNRGVLSLCGTAIDEVAERFLGSVDRSWQDNRRKRDGEHFHVTLLTKAELQRACDHLSSCPDDGELASQFKALGLQTIQDDAADVARSIAALLASKPNGLSSWVPIGRGRTKDGSAEATFIALLWPSYASLRRVLGLEAHDLHITLGFFGHDVHGKPKGVSSLVDGVPTAESLPILLSEATALLEAGRGTDMDSDGIEQLVEVALLGAVSHGDESTEIASLRALCELHGRMKRGDRLFSSAERLLELDPYDETGTRSRAYALVMLKRYSEALPALEKARGFLHTLSEAMRAIEESRLEQAFNFCKKKTKRV